MKITRGKTFHVKKTRVWEKIEVELDSTDLLPEEQGVAEKFKPTLLEIRAEKQLIVSMERLGQISTEEAQRLAKTLETLRQGILRHRG